MIEFNLDILQHGLLVRVSVHGAGLLENSFRWEEFGIDSKNIDGKRVKAGKRTYFPSIAKQINSWATMVRQAPSKHCYDLESINVLMSSTSWNFLLFDTYDAFLNRLGELDQKLYDIKAELISNYDYYFAEDRAYWRAQALDAFDTLISGYASIEIFGKKFAQHDREAFADFIADAVMNQAPTLQEIQDLIYSEHFTSVAIFNGQLDYEAQKQSHERKHSLEMDERTARLDARKQAILEVERERARKQLSEIKNPLDELMEKLLEDLSDGVNALIEKDSFKGRARDTGRRFAEIYQQMGGALLDNEKLDILIAELKARMDEPATQADDNGPDWMTKVQVALGKIQSEINVEKAKLVQRTQSRAGRMRA